MKKLNQVQNLLLATVIISATAVMIYMMAGMWQPKTQCNNLPERISLQKAQVNMLSTKLI